MQDPSCLVHLDQGVGEVTINRPERRNAMTWRTIGAVRDAFVTLDEDPSCQVIVLRGAGEKAFSSGVDLAEMGEGASVAELHRARSLLAELFETMWRIGTPIIARVEGYALAGGFGLAMAADVVLAAESAVFGTPEVEVGLWPFQITVPLLRVAPTRLVLELMLTGRRLDASEALARGLVNEVAPASALDARVADWCGRLRRLSSSASRLGKRSFHRVLGAHDAEHLDMLVAELSLVNEFEDAKEGLRARRERREPRFHGR
jgi:enoyl-CoA hydratase/carnithine racemase